MDNQIKEILKYLWAGHQICTDSRNINEGEIFIALRGARFDGNCKAAEAISKGALLAVVDDAAVVESHQYMLVDDGLRFLQSLATHYRKALNIPVFAITGSNGKTTTKELIASVLSYKYSLHFTQGNFNNHIGLPLTILSAPRATELLILEMGANNFGDIDELCAIADPDFGLITNIGEAHLERLNDLDGVFREKSSLFRYIRHREGLFFLNLSDEYLKSLQSDYKRTISYTSNGSEGFQINSVSERSDFGYQKYQLQYGEQNITFNSQLIGAHNLCNIAAAITVGLHFEVNIQDILKGIEKYVPTNMRSQMLQTERNLLILDAYNANPSSMRESIRSFSREFQHNAVLILGDMFELGEKSQELHQDLVQFIEALFVGRVLLVGKAFSQTSGLQQRFETLEELINSDVLENIKDARILIKASRGMRLEQLCEKL